MNFIVKIGAYIISFPARMKGMAFGKNSFIGYGYDLAPILRGVELGDNVLVGRNAWFDISTYTRGAKIIIGDGTQVGRNATLSACDKISIGKKCLLSYNISIIDHNHDLSDINVSPMESKITPGQEIIIEDHCFIGAHSFILKGVRLGRHCVVGANSVVTKSFPANCVIAGSPAKLIKILKDERE